MVDKQVKSKLNGFKDPETGRGIVDSGQLQEIEQRASTLEATLALTTHSAALWKETRENFVAYVRANLPEFTQVEIKDAVFNRPPGKIGQLGLTAKSVIAVGSGKHTTIIQKFTV